MADDSVRRARVDVDESDVDRIRSASEPTGPRTCQKFWGELCASGVFRGRRKLRTDEPTERVNTKILQTRIELESARDLPVGLRVNAFILFE